MAISIRAAKIDRLGKLAEQIAPVKPLLKEYEDLRKEIAAWFDDQPPDIACSESGQQFEVEASPRGNERKINLLKLSKKLGPKKFLSVVKVPMSVLDQHVSPEDQKDMVTTERTGSRSVTVSRKGKKEAA